MNYRRYFPSILSLFFAATSHSASESSRQLNQLAAHDRASSSESSSSNAQTHTNTRKRIERIEGGLSTRAEKISRTSAFERTFVQPITPEIFEAASTHTPASDDSTGDALSATRYALQEAISQMNMTKVIQILTQAKSTFCQEDFSLILQEKSYVDLLLNLRCTKAFVALVALDKIGLIPNNSFIYNRLNHAVVRIVCNDKRSFYAPKIYFEIAFGTFKDILNPLVINQTNPKTLWTEGIHLDCSWITIRNLALFAEIAAKILHQESSIRSQPICESLKTNIIKALYNNLWSTSNFKDSHKMTIKEVTDLFTAAEFLESRKLLHQVLSIATLRWAQEQPDTRWAELNLQKDFIKKHIYLALISSPTEEAWVHSTLKKKYIYNRNGTFNVSIRDILDWDIPVRVWQERLMLCNMFITDISGLESIPNPEAIRTIELQYNFINHLPPHIFRTFTHLDQLKLNNNSIDTIEGEVFSNLHALTGLYLSANRLRAIDVESLEPLINVETIFLAENPLSESTIWQRRIRSKMREVKNKRPTLLEWK